MRKPYSVQRDRLTFPFLLSLLLFSLLPPRAARAQSTAPVSYTFEECDQVDEDRLREELNRITQTVVADEQSRIDVIAIVNRHWQDLGMDLRVDRAVDDAIELVRSDTGFWERIWSGWSVAKAEELATEVAEQAFGSEGFASRFDELSTEVANDIVEEIRVVAAKSASTALNCVQEFIGGRFSRTLEAELDRQIEAELALLKLDPDTDQSFLDILEIHSNLAGGIAVIIGTRIGAELAKRLASVLTRNIVGRILSRILTSTLTVGIPFVGWIVGGALVVIDLYNSRDGALPLIQDSFQNDTVKTEMQRWMAEAVSEGLRLEMPTLARNVANSAFSQWQEFRRKFTRVLELSESNPRFKRILDFTDVDQLAKLSDLVALVEEYEPDRLQDLINSGQFEFMQTLPEEALEIYRHSGKSESLVSWAKLAGDLLLRVVDYQLYQVSEVSDFADRDALEQVLGLEDKTAILKSMSLDSQGRKALLDLTTETARSLLLADLTASQLSLLAATYLTALAPQDSELLANFVLNNPALLPLLEGNLVRDALLKSQNLLAALNFLAEGTTGEQGFGGVFQALKDLAPLLSGAVPWLLFWQKNGKALSNPRNLITLLGGLLLLLLVLRLAWARRRTEVNVTVNVPDHREADRERK
ncbi:MAG: hypothetical protein OXJ55_12055 [Caldilineaceae bacterium]|nr:hypothetical protein [Caldilineaceae bacterium]